MLKLHPGKGRQEGWGGPSPDCLLGQRGPHVTVSVHTSNWFTVKSYHPQKNELIWALATVTSSAWRRPTAVLGRKMLGIKGVCTYGCGVFLNNQTPKAKVNEFGTVLFPADPWAGYLLSAPPDHSVLLSLLCARKWPSMDHTNWPPCPPASSWVWIKEAPAGEQRVAAGCRIFIPLASLLPSSWLCGGLTVGVLIPWKLLVKPQLLSASGDPYLSLPFEA